MEKTAERKNYERFLEGVDLDCVSKYNIKFDGLHGFSYGTNYYVALEIGKKLTIRETPDVWEIITNSWDLTFWKETTFAHLVQLKH